MPFLSNPLIGNSTLGGGSLVIGQTLGPSPEFIPPIAPSLPYSYRLDRRVKVFRSLKGYEQVSPRAKLPMRTENPVWREISDDAIDYIISFFEQFEGQGGPFYWRPPKKIPSPLGNGPVLSKVSGASGSGASYSFLYAWHDATSGTTTKASQSRTITRSAGELVHLQVPTLPRGVDSVKIYAGATPGTETLEDTITETTWTEPTSGFPAGGGADPETTNGLRPLLRWVLMSDIEPTMSRSCNAWNLELLFAERRF